MDKRLFKEIKRTDEKKIEDMLLQYIKQRENLSSVTYGRKAWQMKES